MQRIAIQGIEASFHHQAATDFFGKEIDIIPCDLPFSRVFDALETGADYAICAIETSLYGQINEVYDLLLEDSVQIVGEVYLRTTQNLLTLPGSKISTIEEIYSHPVAIAECLPYLKEQLPQAKLIEYSDTAASAQLVAAQQDPTKAAIASLQAAQRYGLHVAAEDIDHNNYTRFVVLKKSPRQVDDANKASLILRMPDDENAGSLHHVLGVFARYNLSMTMIHSRPVTEKAWHYFFYVDLLFDNHRNFTDSLAELRNQHCDVTVLGTYQSGRSKDEKA